MKYKNRITTDDPQSNLANMLNIAFPRDNEVYLRYASEDCATDDSLRNVVSRACDLCKDKFGCDGLDGDMELDTIGEILMGCSMAGCPIASLYFPAIQACECRERLKHYEDAAGLTDVLGETEVKL